MPLCVVLFRTTLAICFGLGLGLTMSISLSLSLSLSQSLTLSLSLNLHSLKLTSVSEQENSQIATVLRLCGGVKSRMCSFCYQRVQKIGENCEATNSCRPGAYGGAYR